MESSDSEADWASIGAQEHAAIFSAVFGDSDTEEDFGDYNCIEEEACTPEQERLESGDSEADWVTIASPERTTCSSVVFGDSDTDEGYADNHRIEEEVDVESSGIHLWEKVEEVEGLWHCSGFLSLKQQQSLSKTINSEGWFSDPLHNQAMRFGDLPGWAVDLSALIRNSIGGQQKVEGLEMFRSDSEAKTHGLHELRDGTGLLPAEILGREPLFDQMIVNSYQPGEGISAHVDLLRFEDGIAIVSLESTCVMSFRTVANPSDGEEDTCTREPISEPHHDSSPGHDDNEGDFCPVGKERSHCRLLSTSQLHSSGMGSQAKEHKSRSHTCERDVSSGFVKKVDVLLNPGDLLMTHGPARYKWTHEITRDEYHQVWEGQPIVQKRRVSVTLRRLCAQKDVD